MKRTLVLMTVVGLFSAIPVISANEEKVTICHIPPGNPDNRHMITVGESAVPAHVSHGDYVGTCE